MSDEKIEGVTVRGTGGGLPFLPDGRVQARYGVDLQITVNSDTIFFAGEVTNLSPGGIFVATHITHPVGTTFNFSIHLGDDAKPVKGIGEVRWLRSQTETKVAGIGIKFAKIEDDGKDRIATFLRERKPTMSPDEE